MLPVTRQVYLFLCRNCSDYCLVKGMEKIADARAITHCGASASSECFIFSSSSWKSSSTRVISDLGPMWIRLSEFEFIFQNLSWLWVSVGPYSGWIQFFGPMKSSVMNLFFCLFVKIVPAFLNSFPHVVCFRPGRSCFHLTSMWPEQPLLFNTWVLSEEAQSLPLPHRKLGFPVYKQHRDL